MTLDTRDAILLHLHSHYYTLALVPQLVSDVAADAMVSPGAVLVSYSLKVMRAFGRKHFGILHLIVRACS